MLAGIPSLLALEVQRQPYIVVVVIALMAGFFGRRWGRGPSWIALLGLLVVVAHFIAHLLLIQMGNTGCRGCMQWPIRTHMLMIDTVLPVVLLVGWLLIGTALLGLDRRRLWPNNSFKGMPLRGTP